MTLREQLEDTEIALHIAQVDCEKWKARAIKLAKFLGIRDCDIDDFEIFEHGRLVDADELQKKYPYGKSYCGVEFNAGITHILNNTPTVLDATMGYKMLNYCCCAKSRVGDEE